MLSFVVVGKAVSDCSIGRDLRKTLVSRNDLADRLAELASVRSDPSLPNGFGVLRHPPVLKGDSHAELVWKQQQFL